MSAPVRLSADDRALLVRVANAESPVMFLQAATAARRLRKRGLVDIRPVDGPSPGRFVLGIVLTDAGREVLVKS